MAVKINAKNNIFYVICNESRTILKFPKTLVEQNLKIYSNFDYRFGLRENKQYKNLDFFIQLFWKKIHLFVH